MKTNTVSIHLLLLKYPILVVVFFVLSNGVTVGQTHLLDQGVCIYVDSGFAVIEDLVVAGVPQPIVRFGKQNIITISKIGVRLCNYNENVNGHLCRIMIDPLDRIPGQTDNGTKFYIQDIYFIDPNDGQIPHQRVYLSSNHSTGIDCASNGEVDQNIDPIRHGFHLHSDLQLYIDIAFNPSGETCPATSGIGIISFLADPEQCFNINGNPIPCCQNSDGSNNNRARGFSFTIDGTFGNPMKPSICVSPNPIIFNTQCAKQNVTITNSGTAPLDIRNIFIDPNSGYSIPSQTSLISTTPQQCELISTPTCTENTLTSALPISVGTTLHLNPGCSQSLTIAASTSNSTGTSFLHIISDADNFANIANNDFEIPIQMDLPNLSVAGPDEILKLPWNSSDQYVTKIIKITTNRIEGLHFTIDGDLPFKFLTINRTGGKVFGFFTRELLMNVSPNRPDGVKVFFTADGTTLGTDNYSAVLHIKRQNGTITVPHEDLVDDICLKGTRATQ